MIRLVPATVAHAPALAACHALALDPAEDAGRGAPWTASSFAALLASTNCFGPVVAPDAAGFALFRVAVDEAELLLVAVVPARRRAGLGRALLDAGCDEARRRGACTVFLEVATGNAAAHALYAAAGFTPVGRRPRYYADGSDALLLRRTLNPAPA